MDFEIQMADAVCGITEDAGEALADKLIELMRATGMPNGLTALGYTTDDVGELVEGTLAQQRLTKLSPRPVDATALEGLFGDSMTLW
jgi:alcohol dehydrogenase class IV